jgi:hypothetical protein
MTPRCKSAAANVTPCFSSLTRCRKCGSTAARLLELRPAGASEYSCLGCGAIIPPKFAVAEIMRDKAVTPYRPQNWDSEMAKIARLRALRLSQTKSSTGEARAPAAASSLRA